MTEFTLTEEQIIKLIEYNLTNKFKYDLDEMESEKRPFGNSGWSSICKDIMEIIRIDKKWEVTDEDELSDLKYDWARKCFKEIGEFIKKNGEKFEIKIVPK